MFEKKAVILANRQFGSLKGKTANDLVMYGQKYQIVAVIDETKTGRDAGEVLGIGNKGIPIVGSLNDALKYDPEALIIGIAPVGGTLPLEWKRLIDDAISYGMDIISGLHHFLSDDPHFKEAARKHKVNIIDVRKPPPDIKDRVFTGTVRKIDIPVVTILSTDIMAGKNVTLIELLREAERRGFNPGFVATGQTTIMIGADAGICIDAIPADFVTGAVEKMVIDVVNKGKNIIFVEGQGALSHPWVGHETLAIIYGSWPDAVILVHNPFLKSRVGFPEFDMPNPSEEIKIIETIFSKTRVVGISVNGFMRSDEEIQTVCEHIEAETGLPTTDVLRFGATKLFNPLIQYLKTKKKF
jgi:uncharacterized NAD-dependent epimerase/dehydratase family protein